METVLLTEQGVQVVLLPCNQILRGRPFTSESTAWHVQKPYHCTAYALDPEPGICPPQGMGMLEAPQRSTAQLPPQPQPQPQPLGIASTRSASRPLDLLPYSCAAQNPAPAPHDPFNHLHGTAARPCALTFDK